MPARGSRALSRACPRPLPCCRLERGAGGGAQPGAAVWLRGGHLGRCGPGAPRRIFCLGVEYLQKSIFTGYSAGLGWLRIDRVGGGGLEFSWLWQGPTAAGSGRRRLGKETSPVRVCCVLHAAACYALLRRVALFLSPKQFQLTQNCLALPQ